MFGNELRKADSRELNRKGKAKALYQYGIVGSLKEAYEMLEDMGE